MTFTLTLSHTSLFPTQRSACKQQQLGISTRLRNSRQHGRASLPLQPQASRAGRGSSTSAAGECSWPLWLHPAQLGNLSLPDLRRATGCCPHTVCMRCSWPTQHMLTASQPGNTSCHLLDCLPCLEPIPRSCSTGMDYVLCNVIDDKGSALLLHAAVWADTVHDLLYHCMCFAVH